MSVPNANVRSVSYDIAQMQALCAHCGQEARVLALALPPNHEMYLDGEWQHVEAAAFIFYIAELPQAVSRRLLELSPGFRLSGEGPENSYWANHCEHCGAELSDEELHCEPGGFMPADPMDAERISLLRISRGLSACAAGYALAPEFSVFMRRS